MSAIWVNEVWRLVKAGLADVDIFEICIQGCVLPGFRPLRLARVADFRVGVALYGVWELQAEIVHCQLIHHFRCNLPYSSTI